MGDISGAARIAASFGTDNAVCIVKHGNPLACYKRYTIKLLY